MKRLGPELKMPKLKGGEMKVPPFLSDLYFDLRERRLLPLVALILIAIVATPFLLAGGSEKPEPVPAPSPITGTPSAARTLTVVKAEPGLRDYKKRLGHRTPTNPFKQRFNAPKTEGGQLNEQTTSTSTSSSTSTTTESRTTTETTTTSPTRSGSGGSSPSGGEKEEIQPGLTFFTIAADIQVTRIETKPDGRVEKTGPTLHKEVIPPAPIPGAKAPVVTYMGTGTKEHLALLLVSPEVTAMFGEGECISGTTTCQLLAVHPGFPETFEYGPNHVRYKINLTKLKTVVTGHS